MTVQGDRQDVPPAGITVAVAAARLGVTPDAVRRRLHRGTLAGTKTADGEWRVWLPEGTETGDPPGPRQDDRQDTARTRPDDAPVDIAILQAHLHDLRDQVTFLRDQLDAKDDQIRANQVIIGQLTERPAALTAGEGAAAERSAVTGEADRADVRQDSRPWWRVWER